MQFLTDDQCKVWLAGRNRVEPSQDEALSSQRITFPDRTGKIWYLASEITRVAMEPEGPCLLWLREWSVWDENQHLYYTLREGYGNHQFLIEAPGHEFRGYERNELRTFLHVSLLSGWGGWLLTNKFTLWFSHDQYMEVYFDGEPNDVDRELINILTRWE